MIPVRRRTRSRFGRRDFLRAAPAGLAWGMWPESTEAQGPDPTSDVIGCAETLAGLEFTDADRRLMRADVVRNRQRYAALRGVEVAADVEPAFVFEPRPFGRSADGPATPHAALPVARPGRVSRPATLEDLAFEPVTTLSGLIERREVSSVDLTRMYLDRLTRYGGQLNCVVTLMEDLAVEQAEEADREIRAGRYRGPLHGIPWGAKDLFATRGARTTWGARPYERQTFDYDATVVERLAEAGAVLVAKLSLGALARGSVWFGGMTRNPWQLSQSSSGSSAGPAAATAAGLVGFAIGTETLGSIMSPAAACGVVGLRPSFGRVSRYGAMALTWTMDKIGPMCRTVEDCVLVFNAIYGPDGRDATIVDHSFRWEDRFDATRLRVGYVTAEFDRPAFGGVFRQSPSARQQLTVLRAALDDLARAGINAEPTEWPEFPAEALRVILDAEAAAAFDDLTRTRGVDLLTDQGPNGWPTSFRAARLIPAVEYLRAQRARTLLARQMDALMQEYDVVLSPSLSAGLTMTNLTGHPAVAVNAGFSEGLPVALMMTGRLDDETTLLQAARFYQGHTRWHTMHPGGFFP